MQLARSRTLPPPIEPMAAASAAALQDGSALRFGGPSAASATCEASTIVAMRRHIVQLHSRKRLDSATDRKRKVSFNRRIVCEENPLRLSDAVGHRSHATEGGSTRLPLSHSAPRSASTQSFCGICHGDAL